MLDWIRAYTEKYRTANGQWAMGNGQWATATAIEMGACHATAWNWTLFSLLLLLSVQFCFFFVFRFRFWPVLLLAYFCFIDK